MADKADEITLTENGEGASRTALNTASGGTDDLTDFVHNILKSTQTQFENMSNKIIARIDDVSRRVDDLEKNLTEMMNQSVMPQD